MELTKGIKNRKEIIVNDSNTAKTMGSGDLEVFATPAMIALMEATSCESVANALDTGCSSVGTLMNVSHVSATPKGMKVYCESTLTEVDGRRLCFDVKAYDESGLIGEGKHERFIIFAEKFVAKTYSKLNK